MKFYRFPDLKPAGIPWTRKHVRDLWRAGRFPRPVELGPNTQMWLAEEVDEFVADLVRARDSNKAA